MLYCLSGMCFGCAVEMNLSISLALEILFLIFRSHTCGASWTLNVKNGCVKEK